VREFILLTAHGYDAHQEALATVVTAEARVRVVDVFAVHVADLLTGQDAPLHGDEVDTSLLLHLAPELVNMKAAEDYSLSEDERRRYRRVRSSAGRPTLASAEKGRLLYERLRERIAQRIFRA